MKLLIALASLCLCAGVGLLHADQTLLLRQPDLSKNQLTFVYAGDIWVSETDGSNPKRLTTHPSEESSPIFSPDGKWIAFAGNYEGNSNVYVISSTGGQPKQLTWHSASDIPQDWSADSQQISFVSSRETDHGRSHQLYHVSVNGGAPIKQMEARIARGRYNEKGELAYIIFRPGYNGLFGYSSGWKGYRGGTVPEVNVMSADKSEVYSIDGADATNINPFWLNGKVYFLSDRNNKIFNLFEYNPKKKELKQLTKESLWDIRAASGHGSMIVYECGGAIKTFDVKKGKTKDLRIHITPDLPQLRPQWKTAGDTLEEFSLSKTGMRALITARGEVFTIPVTDGSARNLSQTGNKREYSAIWSPDSQQIAWITETDDGQQEVVIVDQTGNEQNKRIVLGSYFYQLRKWTDNESPQIVFTDNHLNLYSLKIEDGSIQTISTGDRRAPIQLDVSPDGEWLAYTLEQPNYYSDLMLYHFESGKSYPVSDGMADVISPAFSPDGKYLYFGASTNSGPLQIGLNMSSRERPFRAALYSLLLANDVKSPLLPKPGDEALDSEESNESAKDCEEAKDNEEASEKPTIDIEGIQSRIVALPITQRNQGNIAVGENGDIYYMEYIQAGTSLTPPGENRNTANRLMVFKLEDKEEAEVMSGVYGFKLSSDHKHIIINKVDGSLVVSELSDSLDPKPVNISSAKVLINPKEEWLQIFNEGWRMQKEYFYAANLHGLDWDAIHAQYLPLIEHVGRREDLNTVLVEMIAELHAGHNRAGGGDTYQDASVSTGLLGANYTIHNNRYQISKIYTGESWNPFIKAPLAVAGNKVSEGEYLLSINGKDLTASDNIHLMLQGTVGEQVTLTVAPHSDGTDMRELVVEPVSDERDLRLWSWVEDNRLAVEKATDGKVGYIYLPNTADAGYTFFNRMFFAQVDKEALIIDERSNGGGQAANYLIEILGRKHLSGWADRDGRIYNTPAGAIHGPKIMLIDQDAGSGGDYLPFTFRQAGLGTLMGTRTWGGLIGIATNPSLMDGGFMTVPFFRFFDTEGNWSVENEGVTPDIEVHLDPIAANNGIDTQLEAAIKEIKKQLNAYKDPILRTAPPIPTELGE